MQSSGRLDLTLLIFDTVRMGFSLLLSGVYELDFLMFVRASRPFWQRSICHHCRPLGLSLLAFDIAEFDSAFSSQSRTCLGFASFPIGRGALDCSC